MLAFDDEFSGTAPAAQWSPTWWVNEDGGGLSHSGNTAMKACYDASYVTVSGGHADLRLDSAPRTCGGISYAYTGSVLTTHGTFSQQGGAFEAMVSIPCDATGYPYGWPAWWTIDSTWTGEIDDVEGGTIVGGTASTLHYGTSAPSWTSPSPACGWHAFGSSWSAAAQTVTFYWDGRPVMTHAFTVGAGNPEYLILVNQMCPACHVPPAGGSHLLVDWVRAWR